MKKTFTIGIILGGITMLLPSVSLSQTTSANYKGRSINLVQSWGGAQACVVASGKINCFDSYAEADKFTGSSDPGQTNASTTAKCGGVWTYVYENKDFKGRRLQFSDRGYWQDYDKYGFRNKQSSWKNPRCSGVHLYDVGTGQYYYEEPDDNSKNMGSWNDKADYIWLH